MDDPKSPLPIARRAPRLTRRSIPLRSVPMEAEDTFPYPPKAFWWFRLGCLLIAILSAIFCLQMYSNSFFETIGIPNSRLWEYQVLCSLLFVVFLAYSIPLWWRRPRKWHWVYGSVLIAITAFTNPFSVALLCFWFSKKTVAYFRDPPESYSKPKELSELKDDTPPFTLFAYKWLCGFVCVGSLLAMIVTAFISSNSSEPVSVWFQIAFLAAFVLFSIPLWMRTPRRWHWWYGAGLLSIASVSGVLTVLGAPLLASWFRPRVRQQFAYLGGSGNSTPL